jgi:diacylglycerol kinase (ATP)
MPATVILNPYSNRWEAGKRAPEVEAALRRAGIEFEMKITSRPDEGVQLAREAVVAGNTPLIAAGGDGGVSEVLNGLMQATPPTGRPAGPLGMLPLGTANDITDMLAIPRDLDQAVDVIRKGNTRAIDLGLVNGRYFDNNSAVGLEPMVTIENIRLTWMRGVVRYLAAAALAILKRPEWKAHLVWDDGEYDGSITLISVGNTRRTGGVFYMTPNATPDDGLLDFIFSPSLGRARLFQLLPKAQTGDHVREPEIREHRTTRLSIRLNPPSPIQADGEVFVKDATEITYQVLPAALQVFVPEKAV